MFVSVRVEHRIGNRIDRHERKDEQVRKVFLTSIAALTAAVSVAHADAGPSEVAERQASERVVAQRQVAERDAAAWLDVDVRFEIATGEFAELELVRAVDEEGEESQLAFTGRTVSEDGKVLIESFTIGADMEYIASIADAYLVKRQQEDVVAWAGGGPDSFEFLTLDGNTNPSTVIAGGGENQLGVRVDMFSGQKGLQREYEIAGGEGSVAIAIALMFRDLHTNASRANGRDDGGCSLDFETCNEAAKCTCGGGDCCAVNGTRQICNVESVSFDGSTCSCSFECQPTPEP
jgi:hypothetical protein